MHQNAHRDNFKVTFLRPRYSGNSVIMVEKVKGRERAAVGFLVLRKW